MAQGDDRDFPEVPDRPSVVALYPWLLIAWGAASHTVHGSFRPQWAAAAGLAAFAVLYMAALWVRRRTSRPSAAYLLLAVLAADTVALVIGFGQDMNSLFPLLSIVCGAVLPWVVPFKTGHGPPLPILIVFAVAAVSLAIAIAQHASAGDIWASWYGAALSGLVVAIISRYIEAVAQLRRTREELARSAVDAERLRFARDMHDLLGHTLSVIVVKAQVVRKLAGRDPAQAQQQAADIEEIGRAALGEVRQAVAGYRGRGLTRELEAARAALADAGITTEVRQDGPPVPPGADALLGWVVREGVTNVIRHSGGRRCEIDVRDCGRSVTVTIRDDGPPVSASAALTAGGGHGLDGLRERLAADGGTLAAGPCPGGGFRLTATVPVPVAVSPMTRAPASAQVQAPASPVQAPASGGACP
jgi:two-component system sensor histidine kinase DesK